MSTLPELTRKIDDAFTETWYEIRPDAADNIQDAIVVWAAMREAGCFTPQVGGAFITRPIRYGTATTAAVAKGDVFSQGEPELETMAMWTWRYLSAHVQRSVFDDQQNNGKFKIKDYVAKRLKAAREALDATYETDALRAQVPLEGGKELQGLNDLLPVYESGGAYHATEGTVTYGKINRPTAYADSGNGVLVPSTGNTWWGSKYLVGTAPIEVNLLSDLKKLVNSVHNNQEMPNLILTDQSGFEVYEEYAMDASQIIKENGSQLADLGFSVLRFKGIPFTWSPNVESGTFMVLNLNHVEVIYDPQLWFEMSEWKPSQLGGERIAHILTACNIITDQPRRHGALVYA